MHRSTPTFTRRPAILLIGLLLLLAACGGPADGPGPLIAVVVAHHDAELQPALSDTERSALRAAALDGGLPPVLVVAAGRPADESVDLTPRRPNGAVEYGARRDLLADGRLTELDAAVDRAAAETTSSDLLAAIGRVVRLGAVQIHVLSAGVSDTDPFDMRVSGFDVDPARVAADLVQARVLPDATGRLIVLSGLGRTAGRQPPLDEAAQRSVRDQWLAVCGAMHANCVLDDGPRALRPGVAAPLPGPVVPVPRVLTSTMPNGSEEVSLPAAVLFRPDSCALGNPASASGLVDALARDLRQGSTATVSGRTAPVGPGDGVALATCRARAVADLLVAAGAPPSALRRVAGDGTDADPPGASRDAAGRPDPTTYPALRRVVLVVTPPARS